MNTTLDQFSHRQHPRGVNFHDAERWVGKVRQILKHDKLERLERGPPEVYLYHPLPGRKQYHILRVILTEPPTITCTCQGMQKNDICTHAIALRILLGLPRDRVYYTYRAPGRWKDIIKEM